MRKYSLLLMLCLWASVSYSQNSSVSGSVRDTAENKNLQHAVVAMLRSSDSVLVKFTRTNAQGDFLLKDLAPGKYVVLITYPKFADYADFLEIKDDEPVKLGNVSMTPESVLMSAVIVRSNNTMRIRGDTTEFTADSFKVREGATVEELLKQIPGMTVNSKGEITAQGKRVDRVLVDGEEFFGEDPTIATQNIGAKAVDKVQVFDTKTEQDQLKGIGASGQGGKTINIKLKDNAKRGYFGKAEAGTNFDKLHNAKVMLNRFQGSQKISVYGTKSSTNTGSLGWEDRNKLGMEDDDYEYDEVSGFYYSYGDGDDEFSSWNLRGLPNAYTAGALYSNRWLEDKHKLNISYLFNRLGTTNRSSNITQTILADSTLFGNQTGFTRGLSQQHAVRGKYEWKIDSLASLKFSVAGTYREKNQTSENSTVTQVDDYTGNVRLLNENERTNDLFSRKRQLDNLVTYKQLFRKKNRQLITTLRMGLVEDTGEELLQSRTNEYANGLLSDVEIIDQLKVNDGRSRTTGVRITYNEPITDKLNIVTEYSLNHNVSESHRNSFDNDGDDKYTIKNDEFSNNFDLNALANSGTVTARYMSKKIRMAAGAGLSSIRLNLNNLDSNSKKRYNFLGFTPQAQIAFIRSQQSQVSLNYRGNTVQPNLNQLQPLRNNADPLAVYVGNPDLKVGFNHNINLNFNDYRVLSGRSIFANVGITFQQNAITQSSTLKGGRRTYMPINVNGNYNYYMWSSWNSGQGDKKWIHQVSPQASGGRSANVIENVTNVNTYANFSLNYSIRYSVMEKYSFNIGPSVSRNLSKSSLAPDVNNNFWTYGGRGYLWIKLPGKFELMSDVESNLRQKTEAFPNTVNITVWNARLTRKFFKDNSFQLDLYAYDILNQNIGFTRNINSNFMTEQRFDRISQYFMLTATWTFNKMPGSK